MKKLVSLLAAASVFTAMTASAQDNAYLYNKFISTSLIPQKGLCDIQKSYSGHEDEDINEYFSGLISAFTVDMNGDSSDELITVEDNTVNVYSAGSGGVESCGAIEQKLITDMGESYANVFACAPYVGMEVYSDTGASKKYLLHVFGMNTGTTKLTTAAKIEKTLSDEGVSEFASGVIGSEAISYSHVQRDDFESTVNNNGYADINAAAVDILTKLGFKSPDFVTGACRLNLLSSDSGGNYRISQAADELPMQTYVRATNIRLGGIPLVIFEDSSRLDELKIKPDIITVKIDGQAIIFSDADPVIINDRTLVPMRKIFETLGCTVDWDGDIGLVTAKGAKEITLTIGSNKMTVDNETKLIDVPAQLIGDRTFVPARAISEALGCTVDWDNDNRTVIITSN